MSHIEVAMHLNLCIHCKTLDLRERQTGDALSADRNHICNSLSFHMSMNHIYEQYVVLFLIESVDPIHAVITYSDLLPTHCHVTILPKFLVFSFDHSFLRVNFTANLPG